MSTFMSPTTVSACLTKFRGFVIASTLLFGVLGLYNSDLRVGENSDVITAAKGSSATAAKGSSATAAESKPAPSTTPFYSFYLRDENYTMDSYCVDKSNDCFHDELWPSLKTKLCPNMAPDTSYSDTLFTLARYEMGMRQWNGTSQSHTPFYTESANPCGFTFINDNKTFIYLSIYKAASESIGLWGTRTLRPLAGTTYRQEFNIRETLTTSKSIPCILTAIRDPISHFLSGYNEVETRIKDKEETKKIDSLRTSPRGLYHRYRYGTKQRFEQFVADLLSVPAREGWNDFVWLQPLHFYSMTGILVGLHRVGARLTAYLPSIDNLNDEWPAFAHHSCPHVLPENVSVPFSSKSGHESSKDLYGIYKAAKDVWAEEGPTARALCVLHAMDYACWENLPNGIPSLCQDVYSTKHFVDGILKKAQG